MIHTGRHLAVNPAGRVVKVLSDDDAELWVETTSESSGMTIRYSGYVNDEKALYEVRLCEVDETSIRDACLRAGMHPKIVPLSTSRRRLLVVVLPRK